MEYGLRIESDEEIERISQRVERLGGHDCSRLLGGRPTKLCCQY